MNRWNTSQEDLQRQILELPCNVEWLETKIFETIIYFITDNSKSRCCLVAGGTGQVPFCPFLKCDPPPLPLLTVCDVFSIKVSVSLCSLLQCKVKSCRENLTLVSLSQLIQMTWSNQTLKQLCKHKSFCIYFYLLWRNPGGKNVLQEQNGQILNLLLTTRGKQQDFTNWRYVQNILSPAHIV